MHAGGVFVSWIGTASAAAECGMAALAEAAEYSAGCVPDTTFNVELHIVTICATPRHHRQPAINLHPLAAGQIYGVPTESDQQSHIGLLAAFLCCVPTTHRLAHIDCCWLVRGRTASFQFGPGQ